jgi:hypothetical protein
MSWTITLGTLIDYMPSRPAMRGEVYKQVRCQLPHDPCRSCSMQFKHTLALALKLGVVVRVGRKISVRGWDAVDLDLART